MIEAICIIAYAVAGGLWRRAFGGWGSLSRVALVCIGVAMTAPAALVLPWWQALIIAVGWAWLWCDGHDFYPATWHKLGYRYLGPPAVIAALIGQPALIVIGPMIFAGYWLTERYWPARWRGGGFVDGPSAVAEIIAGAVAYGVLAATIWMPANVRGTLFGTISGL